MNFMESDITLEIEGTGIVFYSPKTVKNIPIGIDYLTTQYNSPSQVMEHLQKGDVVSFCTGSNGVYSLKFRMGYPSEAINKEYPVSIRLGIDVQDNEIHIIDLFWLMDWDIDCPREQIINVDKGFYQITLNTKKPNSGIWGDNQTIFVHLNKLTEMPTFAWNGVPQLLPQ